MKDNHVINLISKLSLFLHKDKTRGNFSTMPVKSENTYSNTEIIDGIIRGDLVIFNYIRENSLSFFRNINGKSGKSGKAEELFQDAIIVIFRKITTSGLTLDCQFITYFIAVCKKIWFYQNNGNNKSKTIQVEGIEPVHLDEEEIENLYMESKEFELYRYHFGLLKKKQQRILEASISGLPYKDLCQQFGYNSADTFKNEVCRIKKNLVRRITSDPKFQMFKDRANWSL
jgi:hypothetical protein